VGGLGSCRIVTEFLGEEEGPPGKDTDGPLPHAHVNTEKQLQYFTLRLESPRTSLGLPKDWLEKYGKQLDRLRAAVSSIANKHKKTARPGASSLDDGQGPAQGTQTHTNASAGAAFIRAEPDEGPPRDTAHTSTGSEDRELRLIQNQEEPPLTDTEIARLRLFRPVLEMFLRKQHDNNHLDADMRGKLFHYLVERGDLGPILLRHSGGTNFR
ncbi:unnamed protein product, partial [Amoebophrya sp. A25]